MPERSSPTTSRRITRPAEVSRDSAPLERTPGALVVAVYGARAGVGVTTVTSALARAFQSICSADVVLAELDPRVVRARSQRLNIAARGTSAADPASKGGASRAEIDNGTASTDRFAIPGLDAALVRQTDGLWMLAMTRPRTPAVGDAKSVTVALDAMRRRFRVSVAELEHQVNERTLAALDAADRILLVTEGAVPSLRGTQRVLRLCHRLNYPDEKMCVVLNRCDVPGSLPAADVAAALKREIYWKIPDDSRLTISGLAERLLAE